MPILKSSLTRLSPSKLYGGPVKLHKEIILGSSMAAGSNPFDEDMCAEMNPLAGDSSPEKNPFNEEEEEEKETAETLNRSPRSEEATSPKRNGSDKSGTLTLTLKKVLGKSKGKRRLSIEEKSEEKKSLFRLPSPLSDQDLPWKTQEKRKGHRQSGEFASPVKLGNGPDKEGPVEVELRKKVPFLKRNKAKTEPSPEKPVPGGKSEKQAETVPKVKEPLSVLEINNLIQKRELVVADSHIIELEEECGRVKQQSPEGTNTNKDSGRKEKDVALLYAALESELGKIVGESLSPALTVTHLEQMVQTIEEEEKVDKAWAGQGGVPGGTDGGRPRELRRKWREAVKGSVAKRLSQCQGNGPIAQCLRELREQTVSDLISVRKNLIPAYPKVYEVFSVYVRSYHEEVSSCLSVMGQKDLKIQELYSFLQWCHNDYFRDVMGHKELTAHISKQQLGPLLPTETVQRLEDICVSMVKTQITKDMAQELSAGQEKWEQGSEMFQSELANRVIQLLKEHVENSAATTQELGSRVALCCLCGLADFLQSFQTSVQRFYDQCSESTSQTERVVAQTIAMVNCCPAFRDYIERLVQKVSGDSEERKKRATAPLDKVTRGGNKLLTTKLFDELKPNFSKLLKKKRLQSTESFESITTIIKQHFNQFRKMKTPPYQELVNDIHKHVVIKYLTAVLQTRITCNSSEMRTKLAGRLSDESAQLKELFESLNSTASWLDPAIDHLAEIVRLKDISTIQMEVGALVSSYPDVRKNHISALLSVRGDVSQADRQSILETLQDFNGNEGGPGPSRDRALFTEIDVVPEMRCISLSGSRGSSRRVGCFSVFRQRKVRSR
ncbi:exocyst complex component 3-like protein 2 [Cetorhinus maximus]